VSGAASGAALTPAEVLALVPQRPPFRFLDEITDISEERITGRYTFRPDESFYAGHFPGMPITPGAILLETMAQTGVVALGLYLMAQEMSPDELRRRLCVFTDAHVEFRGAVLPGDTVTCHGRRIFWRRHKLRAEVEMTRGGELVASATLAGMAVPHG
jgi:3-hydroxyacyl-[acyl-carrier-protein] dehydratase